MFYGILFLILPQSLVLEYVHGHKRLIFVAPKIRNGFPCSYKGFLRTSDVPCLLGRLFSTHSRISFPVLLFLRATLPHLSSSQLLDPWWCFSSLSQQDLTVLLTTFRQHSIASLPLPRPSYCLYPHRWADTSFSKVILHSAGEFSSEWQIIQKYFKTKVRQEVWEEFSLKIPEATRKSQHGRVYQLLEKCTDVQMVS